LADFLTAIFLFDALLFGEPSDLATTRFFGADSGSPKARAQLSPYRFDPPECNNVMVLFLFPKPIEAHLHFFEYA
jgi:hypothetical protein